MYANIQPLSEIEKRDAEQHHNWVYSFLHRHNYSIELYYDVVVMGYLKGIQDYHRKPGVKEIWGMSTICERAMLDTIYKHFRHENAQKRKPSGGFVSIDSTVDDYKETYINSIITPTLEDEFFEEWDRQHESGRIKELLSTLTDRQREIVILKASGKQHSYIAKKLRISEGAVNRELKKLRDNLKEGTPKAETRQLRRPVEDITEYIGVPTEVILTLKLSARQLSVLNLLMVGYRESEIGRELGLTRQAVYDAVRKIRQKADKVK